MEAYQKTELNQVKRGANRAVYDVEKINSILDAGFLGYVSYVFQGKAITLPMAYGRIDNKLYLHGSRKNRMLLALLEAEEVSMTVMHLDGLVLARSGFHHSVNYRSATLFGTLKVVEDSVQKEIALARVVDQMVPNRWNEIRSMNAKELNGTLVAEFQIETASAKIRDVGVLDEKSDLELPIWAGIVPIRQVVGFPISDTLVPEKVETPKHVLDHYEQHKDLRTSCENCHKSLPADSKEAMACSYNCTFCEDCVSTVLKERCPNCGGDLKKRL